MDTGQSRGEYRYFRVECPAEIHPKYNKPKPDNHCKPLNPTPVNVTIVYGGSHFAINSPIKPNSLTPPEKRWGLRELTHVIVAGVNTPKTNSKCSAEKQKAIEARNFTQKLILDKSVTLQKIITRKFTGHVIADVILDGGESLADKLIKEGLGQYSYGGEKESWCLDKK